MRRNILPMIAITASLLVSGCATSAKKLNEISIGMSKSDVIKVLGSPESVRANYGQEILMYTLSNDWGNAAWHEDYFIELRDGKVFSYGK